MPTKIPLKTFSRMFIWYNNAQYCLNFLDISTLPFIYSDSAFSCSHWRGRLERLVIATVGRNLMPWFVSWWKSVLSLHNFTNNYQLYCGLHLFFHSDNWCSRVCML